MSYIKPSIISLVLFFSSIASANIITTIPFQNIAVNTNDTITASFAFGPNSLLFCYSDQFQDTGITGNIAWPFQGNMQSSTIPITLATNANFQGQPIDSVGTIVIQNTLSTTSVISCIFAY